MSLFDRTTVARIAIATLIVLPPVVGYQQLQQAQDRAQQAERTARIATELTAQIAQEKIERTVTSCQAANEERVARIAASKAIIQISVATAPPLDLRGQLLLAAFVKKANHEIETASHPKVCTIHALHLDGLEQIVRAAQPLVSGGATSTGSGVPLSRPTPARPGRHTTTTTRATTTTTNPCPCPTTSTRQPCVKKANRGNCRGKP